MHRRSLLLGAAAAIVAPLARPAIAGNSQTLSIVPQVALNSIDPVWTSSQIARNMGFMVFDLLYGRDEAMNPRPQASCSLAGSYIPCLAGGSGLPCRCRSTSPSPVTVAPRL